MVSFGCDMNSGANDETAAAEDLDLTMLLSYPALFSVMLHRSVAGLHYSVAGSIALRCGS